MPSILKIIVLLSDSSNALISSISASLSDGWLRTVILFAKMLLLVIEKHIAAARNVPYLVGAFTRDGTVSFLFLRSIK